MLVPVELGVRHQAGVVVDKSEQEGLPFFVRVGKGLAGGNVTVESMAKSVVAVAAVVAAVSKVGVDELPSVCSPGISP